MSLTHSEMFCFSGTSYLRGHCYKLFKNRFATNMGKFCFANRVVHEWNLLPHDIVSCETVTAFKVKLDPYLKNCRGFT